MQEEAGMAEQEQWMQQLQDVGAYLEGHFELTTGRHSGQFFMLARLTERPWILAQWAKQLASQVHTLGPLGAVVGPAMGGIIPGYAVAQELKGVRMIFAEKGPDQTMVLRRGFRIELDEPVVVVEDAVTTGASVTKVIEAVEGMGGRVMAVAALVDRTGGQSPWAIPLLSVVSVAIPSWIPSQCPLCASEVALIRPKA